MQCTLGWRVVRVILCIVSADVSFDSPLIYVRVDLSLGGQKRSPLILALQSRGQCAAAGARVMSITRQPAKFLVFTHRISSAMYIKRGERSNQTDSAAAAPTSQREPAAGRRRRRPDRPREVPNESA